jgi:hypothetical protein
VKAPKVRRAARQLQRFADIEPFELFTAFMCVVVGIPLSLNGPRPNSIDDSLPALLVTLWGIELAVGGILTIVGLALTGTSRGVRIERAGLLFLAAASAVYALVLVPLLPISSVTIALLVALAGACLWRRWSVRRTAVLHFPRRK